MLGSLRDRFPDGVDALLDLVNYTPGTYDAALKQGARVASPTGAAGEGPGRTMVMAVPTKENLDRVAQLLDSGAVKVPVQGSYPLEAPPRRYRRSPPATQGKLAIRIA
jgi:NADPH2:quinone reductase